MVSGDRQRVIEANRSLRLIKNELESLLEKGVITDDAFDSIHSLLPTESSISGSLVPAAAQRTPAPVPTPVTAATPTPLPAANNNQHHAAPPSYNQSTGGGPPPLPGRNPPPPAPGKPAIAHAKALYKYVASDARDCSFERDDRIAVYDYMNTDWWMGRNLRTGQEGIFPKSYVETEQQQNQQQAVQPLPVNNGWSEKTTGGFPPANSGGYPGAGYQPPPQPMYGGTYPPQPPAGQVNPYNPNAPPPGQPEEESGVSKHGKKFGKKLGNAAIFGAGATIGSNLVNSIF
ncbi:SH3 domain-containing protein [Bombardia bombarda]|uniref:SH3 domain-containing protein n=1 Tax=Bombardia bombarda TaxID=252184 RepID=A0AA39X796_9PEZI|nr:SH3 domain-containing protein [Bombardia bombarda]